jgi:hypothetical protein
VPKTHKIVAESAELSCIASRGCPERRTPSSGDCGSGVLHRLVFTNNCDDPYQPDGEAHDEPYAYSCHDCDAISRRATAKKHCAHDERQNESAKQHSEKRRHGFYPLHRLMLPLMHGGSNGNT